MKTETQKSQTAAQPSHIDRIPDKVLTHGLCIGLVVVAFAWLIVVGSAWN